MAAQVVSTISADHPIARRLADTFVARGLPCEIEAGPAGVLVYAGSMRDAARISAEVVTLLALAGVKHVVAERVIHEPDEPAATAYVATVRLDWSTLGVMS